MPPTPKATVLELEEIREESARKAVQETYRDGAAALKFFDGYIAQKEKGLKAFHAEVVKNQELAAAFAKNPAGTLHERGLLGPLIASTSRDCRTRSSPCRGRSPYCHFHYGVECRVESTRCAPGALRLPLLLARVPPPLQVGRPDSLPLLDEEHRGAGEASRPRGIAVC